MVLLMILLEGMFSPVMARKNFFLLHLKVALSGAAQECLVYDRQVPKLI